MNKIYRIKKSQEIDDIIKARKSVGNKWFVIYRLLNNETTNYRYAISIGKKYGNAVERNLMKRRIREIVRSLSITTANYIIVVKPLAKDLKFKDIEDNLRYLFNKRRENE